MTLTDIKPSEGSVRIAFKTNWLRSIIVLSFGTGASLALCMGAFDVVQSNPKEGFGLLRAWGPWAIVVALVTLLGWKLCTQAIGIVNTGLNAWVQTANRGATAQEQTAEALTKLAEQGGRSAEEVRRLAIYAAQEFPEVYQRFDRQDAMLKTNYDAMLALQGLVTHLSERFDRMMDARPPIGQEGVKE